MITEVTISTREKIEYFKGRYKRLGYGESHYVFACHAAFPLALTPDLLSQLWANFKKYKDHDKKRNIDSIAISDILLSSLVREVRKGVFEMDMETRAALLHELEHDNRFGLPRMKELAYFLYQYIQEVAITKHNKAFVDAQTWTALATLAPQHAAQELVSALKQAIQGKDNDQIFRLRNLLESYSNQDEAFENLLHYSKGIKAAILNFPTDTIQRQFNRAEAKVLTIEEGAQISDSILDIPMLSELEQTIALPEKTIKTKGIQKALERIKREKKDKTGILDLSRLELSKIPQEVYELKHLKELDLFINDIKAIPEKIGALSNLEKLLISINPISKLPDAVKQLTNLKAFKLDNGKLIEFPKVLLSLPNLESISLEKNQIEFVPSGVKNLKNLRLLDLRYNPLVNIPKNMRKSTGARVRTYFEELQPIESNKDIILFLGSNPENKFDLDRELQVIASAFSTKDEIIHHLNASILDICELCYKHQNQVKIYHFASEKVNFLDEDGVSIQLSANLLAKIIGRAPRKKLVVLNTNPALPLAKELSGKLNIPCIAMRETITDNEAIDFSKSFYAQLSVGKTLNEIFSNNDFDHLIQQRTR